MLISLAPAAVPALAQEGGEGAPAGVSSILIFISGAVLLVYSAEKLIGYLVASARGLGISAFVLAIVFTGIEFDDVALGVALGVEGVDDVALGIVFGTALSLSGVALAIACILRPPEVDIPRDYLVLFAASPFVILPFVFFLASGALTTIESVVLIAAFVLFVVYIAYRERESGRPVVRNQEVVDLLEGDAAPSARIPSGAGRNLAGAAKIGLAVVALAGLVIGAATAGMGAEGIVTAYGIEGTIFGATFVTAVLTVEDVLLTVEPIRKGAPELGIGNVIGSVVFSVTGKLGIIGLAGSVVISGYDLTWHFGMLAVLTLLTAYFLVTKRLKRWQGYLLLGLYVTYWVVSYFFLGVLPAEL